jgi:hypothetical protein
MTMLMPADRVRSSMSLKCICASMQARQRCTNATGFWSSFALIGVGNSSRNRTATYTPPPVLECAFGRITCSKAPGVASIRLGSARALARTEGGEQ